MSVFQETKIGLIEASELSRDALHVHVGLAIFVGVALVFRLRPGDWRPLLAVLVAALAGEIWDWIDDARGGYRHLYAAHLHDLANTLFWPAALFLLARYTRLFKR